MNRDAVLSGIRPVIESQRSPEDSALQIFQDTTLRPILKLQHDFILRLAGNVLLKRHPDWDLLDEARKAELISAWSTKDLEVKKQMEGALLGLMTGPELDFYFQNEREIQRRIRAFVIERIRTGLRKN